MGKTKKNGEVEIYNGEKKYIMGMKRKNGEVKIYNGKKKYIMGDFFRFFLYVVNHVSPLYSGFQSMHVMCVERRMARLAKLLLGQTFSSAF